MREFKKSVKLDDVCYDIRGPILEEAKRLEAQGLRIRKLNIGNPAPFGFKAPEFMVDDVIKNLESAEGYCDSKGLLPARQAIANYCKSRGINGVTPEDIYTGNGVSELINMTMHGLLNRGDEVLVPAPDYPLWTAAVNLSGGKAVHYICDESSDWQPDLKDIRSKITPNTKGLVVINPNNPTGAVYTKENLESIIEIAREHELILYSDEIYEKILYDDTIHYPLASLADDLVIFTFNGLSKSFRIAGFRIGWMVISGNKTLAKDYIEGINILSGMRLCSNVPAQLAVESALQDFSSVKALTAPGGRLCQQRDYLHKNLLDIPGISCVKPKGAFYLFPRVDTKRIKVKDDYKMVYDLLKQKQVLMVQGTGFNWPNPDHFRIVYLPDLNTIKEVLVELKDFFADYSQE